MSEGGKPGITARVKVLAVGKDQVLLETAKDDYFVVEKEYMAHFVPVEAEKDGE